MDFPRCRLSCLLPLLLCACQTDQRVPFTFDGQNILFEHNNHLQVLQSEDFAFVADWSKDYSRGTNSTGYVRNGFFVFKGALNHSRKMYFVYDLNSGRLQSVPNASDLQIAQGKHWAAVLDNPLYAEQDNLLTLVVDDTTNAVAQVTRDRFLGMHWKASTLSVTLAPR